MKAALLTALVAILAMAAFTTTASASVAPFKGGTFCLGGTQTVTAKNLDQQVLFTYAVFFKLKLSTDEVSGGYTPYWLADADSDDVTIVAGACPAAPLPIAEAYLCPPTADPTTVPWLIPAPGIASALKLGYYSPTASPGFDTQTVPSTGYNEASYPTWIGTAKHNPATLHCGVKAGGAWWENQGGDLSNFQFGLSTAGEYPVA